MNLVRFQTRTYGKWILAGEHAVLRGCPALAFPLKTRVLQLEFEPTGEPLSVRFAGEHGDELNLLFWGVLENALSRLKVNEARGQFRVENTLPIGAGLGASAALCGAVARWCEAQGWIPKSEIYEFARRLEDLFHGESSGVDLAVSLSGEGVKFVRGGQPEPIQQKWSPQFYLSYSGQRGMTSDCVNKVKALWVADRARAERLDADMRSAVALAEEALAVPDGFAKLKQAMQTAAACFESWGLSGGELGHHMRRLREAGAEAVKPTGSGGGGYVLSLWRDEPPSELGLLSANS